MTNAKNSRNTKENTQNERNEMQTKQREWHALKPGDTVLFNGEWREVFDAYPIGNGTVVVKLTTATGDIETHRVRVTARNSKATCRD